MDKRLALRRRGHRTFDRTSLRRFAFACETLESRHLLSADPWSLALPSDSQFVGEQIAEGEATLPVLEIQSIGSLSVSTGTGYKAQSKVWQHDGKWWAAVGGSGTNIWRLDGTKWTSVLKLSTTAYRTDVKSDGDLVHVLLFPDGPATKLVSAEYVPAQQTYKLWSLRPAVVDIPLKTGVRIATLDIDSAGRMWVAADTASAINLHYSEPESNYSIWKGPVTIGTGVQDGDIAVVTTLRNGSIGVLWSNQNTDRFLFREHRDFDAAGQRNDPANWGPLETAAGEAALKVGGGMADDHLNVAVSADGTLYAGVKTSYDNTKYTEIGALVRRPNGVWDPTLYHVSYSGTRPIIVLNDALGQLMVFYDGVYHTSLTDPISFGPKKSLPLDSNVTSTKQNWVNELVVLGGGKAVMIKTDAIANSAPTAVNDSFLVDEDQSLVVAVASGVLDNDTDSEGDALTSALVASPAHGSLALHGDGSFSYTPAANYFGTDSFTYRAADGFGTSNVAIVSISITAVNDAPVAVEEQYSVDVDQLLTISGSGVLSNDSDPDGDPLSANLVQNVAYGSLTFNTNGTFAYQPDIGFSGIDTFTYTADDGTEESPATTVTIRVNLQVNHPPVAVEDSYTTAVDETLIVTALEGVLSNDSDSDGDALGANLETGPAHGKLSVFNSDGSFTYIPNPGFTGQDHFFYRSHDGSDPSELTEVSLSVVNPSPPVSVSFQDGLNGYSGTVDTSVRGDQTTTNYGANSKLELDGSPDQVGLIRWDMTGIPVASTVVAASITVNVVTTSVQDFEVYEALRAWDEMKATFLLAATGSPWAVPGAAGATDHGAEVLAALTGPSIGLVTIPLNAQGVAVVQKWVANPSTNFGIVIQDLNNASTDDLDISSSEEKSAGARPKLTIQVSMPPTSPTASTATSPLHNSANQFDVDSNGTVSPADVLVVFNALNRIAEGEGGDRFGTFLDVSGDGVVSPRDALLVINFLNRPLVEAEGGGHDPLALSLTLFDQPSVPVPAQPTCQIVREREVELADVTLFRKVEVESCDTLFALIPASDEPDDLWSPVLGSVWQQLVADRLGSDFVP